MVSVWLEKDGEEQKPFSVRLYSPPEERVRLVFQPLRPSDRPHRDPQWEDWHSYLVPLAAGYRDYEVLLKEYFLVMYPATDPMDGSPVPAFDPCSPNWVGKGDWEKVIALLRQDLERVPRKRRNFYDAFLRWLEAALTHTDIIVVEGNL